MLMSWRREWRERPSTICHDGVVVRHGRGRCSRVGMMMLMATCWCDDDDDDDITLRIIGVIDCYMNCRGS